jgi:hypothetical protein
MGVHDTVHPERAENANSLAGIFYYVVPEGKKALPVHRCWREGIPGTSCHERYVEDGTR